MILFSFHFALLQDTRRFDDKVLKKRGEITMEGGLCLKNAKGNRDERRVFHERNLHN